MSATPPPITSPPIMASRIAAREGPGLRLAGFGAALALVFGAGLGVGTLVGPVGAEPVPPADQQVPHP